MVSTLQRSPSPSGEHTTTESVPSGEYTTRESVPSGEHTTMESVPVVSTLQLCVCVSLASDSLETIEVIIKLGTVDASDMSMH